MAKTDISGLSQLGQSVEAAASPEDAVLERVPAGHSGALYLVRFTVLKMVVKQDIAPQVYIAPRGLITILLFFVIGAHSDMVIVNFNTGILLLVILVSSLVMTVALILYRGENVREVLLSQLPIIKMDKETKEDLDERIDKNVENQDFNQF